MDFRNIVDPKVFGSGKWDDIHMLATYLGQFGEEGDRLFCILARFMTGTLPCYTCTGHANTYNQKHPPEYSIGYNVPKYGPKLAMLYWTVGLHNNANVITGKREMGIDEAYKLYWPRVDDYIKKNGTKVCDKGCLGLTMNVGNDALKEKNIHNQNTSLVYEPQVPSTAGKFTIISRRG